MDKLFTEPDCASISPVEDIVAEIKNGKMVVLIDDEDRENEGDLLMAADFIDANAINFMAKHGRGLICLTLTRERCEYLGLMQMASRNGTRHSTAFTVSIEAAQGVDTGISAADRARTVQVAVASNTKAQDLVQPGHIFPVQAVDGGVLIRAGHTEAGCDLAQLAGCTPASVICEIMNDDGTMARLPDLQKFAAQHGLKIGTIADLIAYRSQKETLVEALHARPIQTPWGDFELRVFRDKPGHNLHLALVCEKKSKIDSAHEVIVRVHEPASMLDFLEVNRSNHSWGVVNSLQYIHQVGSGVMVLLNCGESAQDLQAQLQADFEVFAQLQTHNKRKRSVQTHPLRTYGIGAQILRQCGVRKMRLLGNERPMPSMAGYDLDVVGFVEQKE